MHVRKVYDLPDSWQSVDYEYVKSLYLIFFLSWANALAPESHTQKHATSFVAAACKIDFLFFILKYVILSVASVVVSLCYTVYNVLSLIPCYENFASHAITYVGRGSLTKDFSGISIIKWRGLLTLYTYFAFLSR